MEGKNNRLRQRGREISYRKDVNGIRTNDRPFNARVFYPLPTRDNRLGETHTGEKKSACSEKYTFHKQFIFVVYKIHAKPCDG